MDSVGPYALLDRIGEGGMAEVWRARAPDGDEVAIKLLGRGRGASEAELARFEREIRVAESISHPHLIHVLDHGVDDALGPWLVMPLVRGMTLRDLFAGQRLSAESALVLLEPMVEALAALHAQGLVHRDVKPENLMLSPLGEVTLVDLGLALGEGDTRHTSEGEVTGSIPYMSPERIEGREIDPSADVWSFAVMLYELVAGQRPFARDRPAEEVAAILSGTFTPLSERDRRVAPELDFLIGAALGAEPWNRPRDAAAVLERMRPLVPGARDARKADRVSVLSDRRRFEARVAERAAAGLCDEAGALLQQGDGFGALRVLDRALAYVPDDPRVTELVERAGDGDALGPAAVPARPAVEAAPARPGRRRAVIGAAVAVALLGVGAASIVALQGDPGSEGAPAVAAAEPTASAPDDARDGGSNGDAGSEWAALDYHRIPDALLSNHDEADPAALRARPDEPLVTPSGLGHDPEETLARTTRELEDRPDDVSLQVERAMSQLALGRLEGVATLERLVRAHPEHAEAQTALGHVRLRQGRFEDAQARFDDAIEADPGSVGAHRHRGTLALRLGRTRDAYRDFERTLEIDPGNLFALAGMTEIYQRVGRVADAAPFLERITERSPLNAEAWASLSIALAASRDRADRERAIEVVERALSLEPDNANGLEHRCLLFSRLEQPGAIAACDVAIQALPDHTDLFTARSLAHSRQEMHPQAIADADRAVELAPGEARHYANRAIVRGRAGREAEAIADVRAACQLGHQRSCARLSSLRAAP